MQSRIAAMDESKDLYKAIGRYYKQISKRAIQS